MDNYLLKKATFLPTDLAGLQLWLAADHATSTREAGMAAQFTAATSEYLSNSGTAALRGQTGTGGWWRAGWIYLDTAAAMTIQSCLGTNVGYLLSVNATPALVLEAGNGTTTSTATHGSTLSTATWYFFYAYYDGTNIGISLNDGADTTTALSTYSPGSTAWNMGALVTPGTYFNGRMQVHFGGDGTLTAAQRTALYNSGTPLAYDQIDPLVRNVLGFFYELNEPSSTRADLAGTNNLTDNNTVTTNPGTVLNAIGTWRDLSGLGNNATQSTQAKKPGYRTNTLNGKPIIRFDGTDDVLITTTASISQPFTIFLVYIQRAWVGGSRLIDAGGGVGFIIRQRGNSPQIEFYAGTSDEMTLAGATIDAGGIFAGICDGADSLHFESGGSPDTGNPGTQSLGSSMEISSNTTVCQVDFAEVIVYNRRLNSMERVRVERYLSQKYGISIT